MEGQQEGQAVTAGSSSGQGDSRGQSHTDSRSHTDAVSDTDSRSLSLTQSASQAVGGSRSRDSSDSQGQQRSRGWSDGRHWERSRSDGKTRTSQYGHSQTTGDNRSLAITEGPGVRHTPVWEERPEFWRLDEQRWRAAEVIIRQPVGHCFVKTTSGQLGLARIPLPPKFYILPTTLARLTRELYERHCLSAEQAEAAIASRQAQLSERLKPESRPPQQGPSAKAPNSGQPTNGPMTSSIWNRATETKAQIKTGRPETPNDGKASTPAIAVSALPRRRGPKPDQDSHDKVAKLIERYNGRDWSSDEHLPGISR
jgi:hypothetical protein